MKKNTYIQIFRMKVKSHMASYAEKMRIFIADEKLAGSGLKDIRDLRDNPDSTWNLEKQALNKAIKREAASLVNRLHVAAYRNGL